MSAAVNRAAGTGISVNSEFGRIVEKVRRATVRVRGSGAGGAGSGVIWRDNGVIVTNAHVAREPRMEVELADSRKFIVELTARDPRSDLAVFHVNAVGLPAVEIGDARAMRTGDVVVAVGNPLGAAGAVTRGILHSSLKRGARWLEADISLAPGNSGGPLADALGRVIGVNSMIVNGLGFAIPADRVERFVRGENARSIGIVVQAVPAEIAGKRGFGLMVVAVDANSPAHLAGIAPGDVLVGVPGELFESAEDLRCAILDGRDSGGLMIAVVRRGRQITLEVPIQEEWQGTVA